MSTLTVLPTDVEDNDSGHDTHHNTLHSAFNTRKYASLFSGANVPAKIAAAVAALGGPGTVVIDSSMGAGAAVAPDFGVFLDDERNVGSTGWGWQKFKSSIPLGGVVDYGITWRHSYTDPERSVEHLNLLADFNGQLGYGSLEALVATAHVSGTLDPVPGGVVLIGGEYTAVLQALGEHIERLRGITASASSATSSTTTGGTASSVVAQGFIKSGTGIIYRAAGLECDAQTAAALINVGIWNHDDYLFDSDTNLLMLTPRAVHDGVTLAPDGSAALAADGAIIAGTKTLASATGDFLNQAVVGMQIEVTGAGPDDWTTGLPTALLATITAITDATHVQLSTAASSTVSGAAYYFHGQAKNFVTNLRSGAVMLRPPSDALGMLFRNQAGSSGAGEWMKWTTAGLVLGAAGGKVAFFGGTPIVKPATPASPSADVTSLKTFCDALRTILFNYGLTS